MSHCLFRHDLVLQSLAVLLPLVGLIGRTTGSPIHGNHTSQYDPVNRPAFPVPQRAWITTFDCGKYFPGTPAWNFCFQKFHSGLMQNIFRSQFQPNYLASSFIQPPTIANLNTGGMNRGSSSFASSGGNIFAGGQGMSSSNSYLAGYSINTVNMGVSSSQQNNMIKITLHTGTIDTFDMKTDKNVITVSVVSKGVQKSAKITIPKDTKVADVKVEKYTDAIFVTGPVPATVGAGTYQVVSSGVGFGAGFSEFHTGSGSAFGGSSTPPNFISEEMINTNGIFGSNDHGVRNPDPNSQAMLGNNWQNMFQDMFRFRRSPPVESERQNVYAPVNNMGEQMWFF